MAMGENEPMLIFSWCVVGTVSIIVILEVLT
jgi:hypothetical protein